MFLQTAQWQSPLLQSQSPTTHIPARAFCLIAPLVSLQRCNPQRVSGARYEFILMADATGDHVIQVTGDDTMMGVAYLGNDSAASSCFYTAATTDTITLNGTTTGGLKGARILIDDVAADTYAVMIYSEASGVEATPFSAAVT
jgi:hypothetical protein